MKITNRSDLPDALVAAVESDPYSKGESDFSVTELIGPPRIGALKAQHKGEVERDVEDMLYSLYGQVAHGILERANRTGFAEKRLYTTIEGSVVSGQLDTLDIQNGVLSDWKFTTAWKFKSGQESPPEFVQQLNMQLELLRCNGMDAQALQIVGLLRDFSKLEAKRSFDYPQRSVMIMPILMWPREKTQAFMRERVILHKQARVTLPECTPEERWTRPTVYAVMKEGAARASKLCDSEEEAKAVAAAGKNLQVVARPGAHIRCENYCDVSAFCTQFNQPQGANEEESEAV